jgi:hypothetical protein
MTTRKDGETRRNILLGVAGTAAAAAAGTQAGAQAATPKLIRAVAVGKTSVDTRIIDSSQIPSTARPYIRGLDDWLKLAGNAKTRPNVNDVGQYTLGTAGANNYVIEYRERPLAKLAEAFQGVTGTSGHVLFCMSTSVGDAAVDFMDANSLTLPMVVVSSHFDNFDQGNVCVVSAERPQLIRKCLQNFKRHATGVTTFHVLHRLDHVASADALRQIRNQVTLHSVDDVFDDPVNVVASIRGDATHGLLVLPADRFFAVGDDIVRAAQLQNMPTYWTAPDWPTSSTGAFGYPQNACGRYMAERVGRIWDRGMPSLDKKDVKIPASERQEKYTTSAAERPASAR